MSKVHPKDHFHFQAIIHSGEYFVFPRIRTENLSTSASFAASALARDGLRARLHGRPAGHDPISVSQSSPVDWYLGLRSLIILVCDIDEKAEKALDIIPPRRKVRGAMKSLRTYLSIEHVPTIPLPHF